MIKIFRLATATIFAANMCYGETPKKELPAKKVEAKKPSAALFIRKWWDFQKAIKRTDVKDIDNINDAFMPPKVKKGWRRYMKATRQLSTILATHSDKENQNFILLKAFEHLAAGVTTGNFAGLPRDLNKHREKLKAIGLKYNIEIGDAYSEFNQALNDYIESLKVKDLRPLCGLYHNTVKHKLSEKPKDDDLWTTTTYVHLIYKEGGMVCRFSVVKDTWGQAMKAEKPEESFNSVGIWRAFNDCITFQKIPKKGEEASDPVILMYKKEKGKLKLGEAVFEEDLKSKASHFIP